METEYIKKDGKVFKREINEEEYDVNEMIANAQAHLNTLTSLKSDTIDKLK